MRKYNNRIVSYIGKRKGADSTLHPYIKLQGVWLQSFGFKPGTTVAADYTQGRVVITALQKAEPVRKLPVHGKKGYMRTFPVLHIPEDYLEYFGFTANDVIEISGEPGKVTVRRLEVMG